MSAWGKANYTKDDFIVSFSPLVLTFLFLCLHNHPWLLPLIHSVFLFCFLLFLLPSSTPLGFFFRWDKLANTGKNNQRSSPRIPSLPSARLLAGPWATELPGMPSPSTTARWFTLPRRLSAASMSLVPTLFWPSCKNSFSLLGFVRTQMSWRCGIFHLF